MPNADRLCLSDPLTVVVLKPLFKQNFHRLNLAHEVPSEAWRDTDQRR